MPLGELARRREIPAQFLEQLFAVLRRAGIVASQRGVKGGYRFARDPAQVTALEVVELSTARSARTREGIFAEAAAAARPCRGRDDRRPARARAQRGRRGDVLHLSGAARPGPSARR